MIPCPKIVTYSSPEAAANERFLAVFYMPFGPTKRHPAGGEVRLPIQFFGPNRGAVVAKAETFWAEEQAKEAKKREAAALRDAAAKADREKRKVAA
ncbi:hypothetical protein [Antarcticirhabdus aurantiaca]|uniref:Uncharacterized protein n=1 Tax=Antarcticirhabdus aurantiaca TaxID=2606717 RepID=A0ACD4NJV9_9HYPH|nr:hypothetical protein [Antarcticirhabdus aurantiaca]WAJ27153.1 hypothetical protein OXU80_20185 [Jeongeuplla avenae]